MRRLFFSAVSAVLFVSSSAFAMELVCSGGYAVVECGDGTQIQCMSGSYQIDCPDEEGLYSLYEDSCADHGGFADVVDEDEVCVPTLDEAELVRDAGSGLATGKRQHKPL